LIHCGHAVPEPATPDTVVAPVVGSADWAPPEAEPSLAAGVENPFALPLWGYEGSIGPAKWGDLNPDFAPCKTGSMQSPINIVSKSAEVDRSLELIEFGYGTLPLEVFNDGHLVRFGNSSAGAMNADGATWKLLSAELHSPSEHAIDGKYADLEMQLVHANDAGAMAIVAVLFDKGKSNAALEPLFEAMPDDVTAQPVKIEGKALDLAAAVPDDPAYYTYMGSLTTPRCTEGVHWFVLQPIGHVSDAQIQKLHAVTHPATNRPVQPLGARRVLRPD
jgi:carbonic anhydrase